MFVTQVRDHIYGTVSTFFIVLKLSNLITYLMQKYVMKAEFTIIITCFS